MSISIKFSWYLLFIQCIFTAATIYNLIEHHTGNLQQVRIQHKKLFRWSWFIWMPNWILKNAQKLSGHPVSTYYLSLSEFSRQYINISILFPKFPILPFQTVYRLQTIEVFILKIFMNQSRPLWNCSSNIQLCSM